MFKFFHVAKSSPERHPAPPSVPEQQVEDDEPEFADEMEAALFETMQNLFRGRSRDQRDMLLRYW